MLNIIWLGLIVVGVFVAGLLGRIGGDSGIVKSAFEMTKYTVLDAALPLAGFMMLWLGMLRLAEKAGLIRVLSRAIRPLMTRLFPEVPPEHPAMGSMVMNMAANMLGLGNAATPLGLKAMQQLEELNPHKGTATNSMCTFLAINTSSVTLVPATAIALVSAAGIDNPYAIVLPAILATLCSTTVAIIAVKTFQRLPAFKIDPELLRRAEQEAEAAESGETKSADDADAPEKRKISSKGWVLIGFSAVLLFSVAVFELAPGVRKVALESTGIQALLDKEQHRNDLADLNDLKSELRSLPAGDWIEAIESLEVDLKRDLADEEIKKPAEYDPKGLRADEIKQLLGAIKSWQDIKAEKTPEPHSRQIFNSVSALVIPFLFVIFIVAARARRIQVYEEFVDGAKEGWNVAIRIMPFLIAMLVAMAIFRDSGALMLLQWALSPVLELLMFPVDLVSMAFMRPLSGGGSIGILGGILAAPDVDTTVKYTAATMFGSTETTFYVLAVYFGAVAIRRTRHALAAGLCADLTGVIASVVICRMMFG
ncbi:MAG: spore maturation protein SpmA [Verrucomicrobiales bacterium]|jgi:spore maturation protein SpmA